MCRTIQKIPEYFTTLGAMGKYAVKLIEERKVMMFEEKTMKSDKQRKEKC